MSEPSLKVRLVPVGQNWRATLDTGSNEDRIGQLIGIGETPEAARADIEQRIVFIVRSIEESLSE